MKSQIRKRNDASYGAVQAENDKREDAGSSRKRRENRADYGSRGPDNPLVVHHGERENSLRKKANLLNNKKRKNKEKVREC